MKKKKEEIPTEKKLFSYKRLMILSITLVAVIVSGFLLSHFSTQTSEVNFSFEAAIIDQIGEAFPSSPEKAREFNETATDLLENAGFNVTYHNSKSITVSFFRSLAEQNYGIIILRGHAALRKNRKTVIDLFTSEKFEEYTYTSEIRSGLLTKGNYSWESGKFYFTVTPKFIENSKGFFPKSIVIAMGCWSLKADSKEMANAFIRKGAKVYIGWTDAIGMSHSDNSIIRFLQHLLPNKTIAKAIDESNEIPDPDGYPGELSFYPSEIGDHNLSDFTAQAFPKFFLSVIETPFFFENKKLR
jgi:hypothetical protein